MTPHGKRPCNLTVRLAEDMRIRNLAHRTIDAYTFHAARFADFIQKPLDCATVEDVRNFQLYLIDNRKTLPVVLGRQEVTELLRCTKNLKQRTFITTLYATGMRFSEAANLTLPDIDSQRMQIRITHGKGAKQRQVPLSPRLLDELRVYWKQFKPTSLLFPGKTPDKTYADTTIQLAIKASASLAGINKNVTPHTFRHSYATGLLEAGVDLLTISRLLGHASFSTTMVYLHCRREHLISTPSPLDWLPVQQLPTYQPAPELPLNKSLHLSQDPIQNPSQETSSTSEPNPKANQKPSNDN